MRRILPLLFLPSIFAHAAALPPAEVRSELVSSLASEMQRLDGEALYVRRHRARTWSQIAESLRREAADARSWTGFLRALRRLDFAYPNLHSSLNAGAAAPLLATPARPKVTFESEWLSPEHVRYVVTEADAAFAKPGDEVVAINGREMSEWQRENFEFCKFPLKAQCDFELPATFRKELLAWTREQPLTYTLQRDGRRWTIDVGWREDEKSTRSSTSTCARETDRYAGFRQIYTGHRACVFTSPAHPGVAVLRITGFDYSDDGPVNSVDEEVDALYPWWVKNATWDRLIVDIIDNHGGEAPIAYYQLLFPQDFQEQYVAFKKTAEMDSPRLRRSIFWNSPGQEAWFAKLVASGAWERIPFGGYTPHVPMFCAEEPRDCSRGLFPVRPHPFKGRVDVLLNSWCVSSCDGFAYNLKEKFGSRARFFGHPQSADTAYARLTIGIHLEPAGFRLEVAPLGDRAVEKAFLYQTVTVTRSTTAYGEIVSGRPLPLDGFVPLTRTNRDVWADEVLRHALP